MVGTSSSLTHKRSDMTQGGIVSGLVLFALPLLITNFFQQFYVTVDSMILGQWSGDIALGAVSSCSYLIMAVICFFGGVSVGAGIVLAQLFGAHNDEHFGRAVWTTGGLALIAGVLMILISLAISRPCLALMNLEGEVLEQGVLYMRVYSISMLPMVVFNMAAAVFRSQGDSRTPMVILIITSAFNLGMALLFVAVCGMGVFGAALATVLAQLLSAVIAVICIWRRRSAVHIEGMRPAFDRAIAKRILLIGIPNGTQSMVISLSSVIISSQVNLFGLEAMDGFGAYSKIDGWIYMPVGSIQSAIVTFVGQNIGAGTFARARRGVAVGIILNVAVTIGLCLLMWALRYPVLGLFSSNPDVIAYGVQAMACIIPLYFVYAFYMSISGLYFGVGSTIAPMAFSLIFMCVMRIAWVLVMPLLIPGLPTIYISYPVSWVCMLIALGIYYFRGKCHYADKVRQAKLEA